LATSVRASVLDRQQALSLWWAASDLFRGQEIEPDGDRVLALALERAISAYDTHFVVVDEALGAPSVTGDLLIVERCPEIAISIDEFAS
jgi:predicted nucleic acid-binding protein